MVNTLVKSIYVFDRVIKDQSDKDEHRGRRHTESIPSILRLSIENIDVTDILERSKSGRCMDTLKSCNDLYTRLNREINGSVEREHTKLSTHQSTPKLTNPRLTRGILPAEVKKQEEVDRTKDQDRHKRTPDKGELMGRRPPHLDDMSKKFLLLTNPSTTSRR